MKETTADAPYLADMVRVRSFRDVAAVLRAPTALQASHRESRDFYGDTLLLLDGDAHFARRRQEMPLFRRDALLRYERGILAGTIARTFDDTLAGGDDAGVVQADLVPMTHRILLEIAAAIVGFDDVDTAERTARLSEIIDELAHAAHVEWATTDRDAIIRRGLAFKQALVEEFQGPAWERRQAAAIPAEDAADLLALLVTAPPDDPDVVVRETILYLMASTQTTTHALPHVIAELDSWEASGRAPQGWRGDLELLKAACQEAVRLHPPVPALLREATADLDLPSGLTIRAGDRLALELAAANNDPEVFGPEPQRFDPLRPLPSGIARHGVSFGGGIHTCIGRSLTVGLMSETDPEADNLGMMLQLLQTFHAAGGRPDPDRPPRRNTASVQDYYESFPVVFGPGGAAR